MFENLQTAFSTLRNLWYLMTNPSCSKDFDGLRPRTSDSNRKALLLQEEPFLAPSTQRRSDLDASAIQTAFRRSTVQNVTSAAERHNRSRPPPRSRRMSRRMAPDLTSANDSKCKTLARSLHKATRHWPAHWPHRCHCVHVWNSTRFIPRHKRLQTVANWPNHFSVVSRNSASDVKNWVGK